MAKLCPNSDEANGDKTKKELTSIQKDQAYWIARLKGYRKIEGKKKGKKKAALHSSLIPI